MWLENNGYPADGRVRREAHALRDAGWDVWVVCPRDGAGRRQRIDGVTVRRYRRPEAGAGVLAYVAEYAVALVATFVITVGIRLSGPVDVVHAHNPPDFFAPMAVVFKLLGAAFVFDQHDLAPEMYRARFGADASDILGAALSWSEKLSYRVADCVISTNESYRAVAIERGRCDPAAVTVVRNGPELAIVYPRSPDPTITARSDLVLGYVGELGPQDGVDHLLRAVAYLRSEFDIDVSAVVVGDGPARASLESLAVELGVADAIEFTGWLQSEGVMRVLSSTDICVGPDPSNEYNDRSTMIKLTEYLGLGRPVVAYDLPENRVTCGEAAWFAAPPDDPYRLAEVIAALWGDAPARELMSRRGLARARDLLAWKHQVPALLAVYDGLAHRTRTAR